MIKFILGAVLAAAAVFAWEAVSWRVLNWHENGFRAFRDESAVAEVIKANVTAGHGLYLLPSMADAPKLATTDERAAFEAEKMQALRDGPYLYAVVRPGKREVNPGTQMMLSYFRALVCALLIGALLHQAALLYPARIAFVAAAGLFAGLAADMPLWIWMEQPARDMMVNVADRLITWVIGGAVLGLFVGREPVLDRHGHPH